jgi:serine/threonine protein kinase
VQSPICSHLWRCAFSTLFFVPILEYIELEGAFSTESLRLQLLSNVGQRISVMHEAGFVHRDLKPANVMWLPRENRWTVIDFGCVARIGAPAPLSFTLAYAAPEVLHAVEMGMKTIESTPALDAWSLGVMAFELLTGSPAFQLVTDGRARVRFSVMASMLGQNLFHTSLQLQLDRFWFFLN